MRHTVLLMILCIVFLLCFHALTPLYAEWEDLELEEHDIYGSEKEEKYPVKSLFIEQEKWDNHYSLMVLWLYKYTDYPKYTSYRVLPLYYHCASKIDNRKKTVIFPLLTYIKTDRDSTTKYLFYPVWYSSTSKNKYDNSLFLLFWWGKQTMYINTGEYTSSYLLALPLLSHYYFSPTKNYTECITPLFYYERENKTYTFWLPIIPLTYHNVGTTGGHRNILWLLDYSWDTEGINRLWCIPFVAWKRGNERYLSLLTPLYIQYMRLSNEHDSNSVVSHYTHILPVYFSWHNVKSQGKLILPLVYDYKDENTTIHINITGYARKKYTGVFTPDVAMSIGAGDNELYIDTDISWLYEVWSFSSRIPLKKFTTHSGDSNLQSQVDTVEGLKQEQIHEGREQLPVTIATTNKHNSSETPQIVKKKTVSREDSLVFWGWRIGFGIMAFEKADSRRHFRLLPLSWLTWDEASKDKLFVLLPFYCSYISDDQEYFVLFPLYGYQKKGDAYFKAYALNLYWDESRENDYHEKTILWPFVNWFYSSDTKGFRIFPLYWYKTWKENEFQAKRSFSLLHYNKEYIKDGNVVQSMSINPLYYKSISEEPSSHYTLCIPLLLTYYSAYGNKENNIQENTLFISGYYRHRSTYYIHDDVLLLYDRMLYYTDTKEIFKKEYSYLFTTISTEYTPEVTRLRLLWGALFEYDYNKKYNNYDVDALVWLVGVEKDSYGFSHKVLPLYYYYSDNHSSLLLMPVLLSGFYREYNNIFDLGGLGLVYYHNEETQTNDARRLVLLGILFDEKKKPERMYHSVGSVWGILWNYEVEQETGFVKFSILKGLYKYVKQNDKTKHTFLWFL